jgi:hypothetical protein
MMPSIFMAISGTYFLCFWELAARQENTKFSPGLAIY